MEPRKKNYIEMNFNLNLLRVFLVAELRLIAE